jgi:ABC-type uncharacterized transport system substrate-binding protein
MRRREFITLLGSVAAAWALPARAQQSTPVIGYLHASSPGAVARFVNAFKAGLKEGGYTEGQNIVIESRFAEGQAERLPAMATELAGRGVRLIATGGAEYPALAAKAAAAKAGIPVVFVFGGDPVKLGLVPSLARPAGHVTGIAMLTSTLESKRFGLLHEIVPAAKTIAGLVDPSRAVVVQTQLAELNEAATRANVRLVVVNATKESELEAAFARAADEGAGALQICANPLFLVARKQLVALAARRRIPTIYEWRDFVEIGGLMSYGPDLANAYREAGVYAAKILNGTKPADLPVMQASKFEFVLNLKTAKAQGIEIAPTVLARADEVIE